MSAEFFNVKDLYTVIALRVANAAMIACSVKRDLASDRVFDPCVTISKKNNKLLSHVFIYSRACYIKLTVFFFRQISSLRNPSKYPLSNAFTGCMSRKWRAKLFGNIFS